MRRRPKRSLWIESSSFAERMHSGVARAWVRGSSGEPVSRSRPALRCFSGRTRAQFPVGRPYASGRLAPRGARRSSRPFPQAVCTAARAGNPRISRTPLARCGRSGSRPGLCLSGPENRRTGTRAGAVAVTREHGTFSVSSYATSGPRGRHAASRPRSCAVPLTSSVLCESSSFDLLRERRDDSRRSRCAAR